MATHFGKGGVANGWSSKGFAVFGIPLFCLAMHILCAFATILDPKQKGIHNKMYKLILLIVPVVSLICGAAIYGYVLSPDTNMGIFVELFVYLLFIVVGNYLPKCRQNYTVGIKLPWTLADEENWNRTHRLAGWLWMLCGLFLMIHAFINVGGYQVLFAVFAVMIFLPTGYSLFYYLKHKK